MMIFDVSTLYAADRTARFSKLASYLASAVKQIPLGSEVILTGPAPVWLYLSLAHALHGRMKKLSYSSPLVNEVVVFDHSS